MPTPTVFESIIANQFLKIPSWARIISYFVALFIVAYQTTFPKFIDGEVREYLSDRFDGEFIPYRDASVGAKYHGRLVATSTSDKGDWSLPMLDSAISGDIELRIGHYAQDGKMLYASVIVPRTMALTENVLVGYNANTPQKVKLLNKAAPDQAPPNDKAAAASEIALIRPAHAQEKRAQKYGAIKDEVKGVIGTHEDASAPADELSLRARMSIRADIEARYGVSLATSELHQGNSAEELANMAAAKVIAKQGDHHYAYYGHFDSSGHWAERHFDVRGGETNAVPQPGDVVHATGRVNLRAGYIEYSLFGGWENKNALGTIEPGETFLIEEVKRIAGDHVWVKLHLIEQ